MICQMGVDLGGNMCDGSGLLGAAFLFLVLGGLFLFLFIVFLFLLLLVARVGRDVTYLGLSRIVSLIRISWATMQRMFRCGPYANRKSQRWRTSGKGGVQAHMVNTDGKA